MSAERQPGTNEERSRPRAPRTLLMARPEAQPYNWEDLGEKQQRTVKLIHQWMEYYVSFEPDALPDPGPFTWQAVDFLRQSNVLFIHGGRGSGKTSVMLTLLEFWRYPLAQAMGSLSPGSEGGPGRAASEEWSPLKYQENLEQHLDGKKTEGLIIPLKPLDLQPLPATTSLLTWMACRVKEFASLLEQQASGTTSGRRPRSIASWYPEALNEAPWRKHWDELATAIAYGWESSLEQRRATLDPDAFAEELTQAGRSLHDVVPKWRQFVSAVIQYAVDHFEPKIKRRARLVIPVDDVDMNPRRCVEVLELVRFLWHPQIVFLLTGQGRLFVKMLELEQHSLLRAGLRHGRPTPREQRLLDSRPSAHELAVQAYDRVIPPSQRFPLGELEPPERMKELWERLIELDDLEQKLTAEFHEELGQASARNKPPADYAPPLDAIKSLLTRMKGEPFLMHGLPPSFRRLRDVQQLLLRSCLERKNEGEMVHLLWSETIEDKAFSRRSDWDVPSTVQLPCVPERGASGQEPMPWKYKLRVTPRTPIKVRTAPMRTLGWHEDAPGLRIELGALQDFIWCTGKRTTREAPRYLTALLLLALDVAVDQGGELSGAYEMNGFESPFVRVLYPVQLDGSRLLVPFFWPTPDWVGSTLVTRFNREWLNNLQRGEVQAQGADESGTRKEPERLWQPLLRAFRTSLDNAYQVERPHSLNRTRYERWRQECLILLTAPESGLPSSVANDLWDTELEQQGTLARQRGMVETAAQSTDVLLEQWWDTAKRLRLRRARLAFDRLSPEEQKQVRSPARLLDVIDEHASQYAWARHGKAAGLAPPSWLEKGRSLH